jgi:hypothetical protein
VSNASTDGIHLKAKALYIAASSGTFQNLTVRLKALRSDTMTFTLHAYLEIA